MDWGLDKDRPICPQLCEIICVKIASGEVKAGDRLRSVRELAVEAGINPNTVQKTYEELERMGLIYSARGSGWYVGDDTSAAKRTERYSPSPSAVPSAAARNHVTSDSLGAA